MDIGQVIKHARDRDYLNVESVKKARTRAIDEVFTPTALVDKILDRLAVDWQDPDKTFIDPTCGDGQFLSEVLIRKVQNGIDFEQALRTVYGVDIRLDNVLDCRERLLCGREDLRQIVEDNIIHADSRVFKFTD